MQRYVYIVESPSAADLFDGRTEGAALCDTFKLSSLPHSYCLAADIEQFRRAFVLEPGSPFTEAFAKHSSGPPIVHLSMHGNTDGIALTSGQLVSWEDLREILSPINNALPDGLMVTFSTCGGAASIRMSMSEDVNHKPFYATIGSIKDVGWKDALIAYSVFYHNWFNGVPASRCLDLMNSASGFYGFAAYSGREQKQQYIEYANRQRVIEALMNRGKPSIFGSLSVPTPDLSTIPPYQGS